MATQHPIQPDESDSRQHRAQQGVVNIYTKSLSSAHAPRLPATSVSNVVLHILSFRPVPKMVGITPSIYEGAIQNVTRGLCWAEEIELNIVQTPRDPHGKGALGGELRCTPLWTGKVMLVGSRLHEGRGVPGPPLFEAFLKSVACSHACQLQGFLKREIKWMCYIVCRIPLTVFKVWLKPFVIIDAPKVTHHYYF